MSLKSFFAKNWIHFAIVGVFLVTMFVYFSPEYDGYSLKQHDVEQYKGMSNETQHFRDDTGEEPLWTNSMFGGMPTIQISTLYNGNVFQKSTIWFLRLVGVPAGIFLLHLLGFYILSQCLKIKPIIGLFGALAFALSTYEILILQAGHNSKAIAVAFMAPVLGAFIMAYRKNWKWGVILSALFMTFELSANHLQVTYYLGILLFSIGVYELVSAIKSKKIKQFGITSGAIMLGYLLALFINYGNITLTNDYAKHTIRGANDLTINPDGTKLENTGGLDKDYITNWSYGKGESFTLLSPYVKGSNSNIVANMPAFREKLELSDRTSAEQKNVLSAAYMFKDQRGNVNARPYLLYWGDQPMTGGPFYLGVIVLFLAFLALIFVNKKVKWVFFAVTILALMLSWGKNFMGFTDFFVDNVPGYNKFRTVTIILVLVELIIPVLGVLFLQQLFERREELKAKKKTFLIGSAGFFVFLLAVKMIGLGDNFMSQDETKNMANLEAYVTEQLYSTNPNELAQYGIDVNNQAQMQSVITQQIDTFEEQNKAIRDFRSEVYASSMNRSLLVAFFSIAVLALFFFTNVNSMAIVGGLIVILLADLIPVDRMYLGSDKDEADNYVHWKPAPEIAYPLSSLPEDIEILNNEISQNPELESAVNAGIKKGEGKADELDYSGKDRRRVIDSYKFAALNQNTSYRVFDLAGSWGSSRASYFHKSLGGYHGAKLRNIQNVFDFHIVRSNNKVYDMLNVKYFLQGGKASPNPSALGNAWLVKTVNVCESTNDEIRALGGKFKLKNLGTGQLIVNGDILKEADVYGGETMKYYIQGKDTLDVPLSNGLSLGLVALFVADTNGTTNLIPEQTFKMDTSNSFNALASIELIEDFNPKEVAVMLNSQAKKLTTKKFSGEGSIKLDSYAPNHMVYSADVTGKQLAVFSEIYYPEGWKAFVDGKEQDIIKVNYLLRGLELDGGKHKIEFKFDLPKLKRSNTFAVLGTCLLALVLAFGIWKIPTTEKVEQEADKE